MPAVVRSPVAPEWMCEPMTNPDHNYDVLVVGAGPAGLAAAACASQSGARVAIVDDNPALGGQIWRGERLDPQGRAGAPEAADWFNRVHRSGVEFIGAARVYDQPEKGLVLAETCDGAVALRYR